MQTDAIEESSKNSDGAIRLWHHFGSIGVVVALALLCFKCAPLYWPFAMLGALGYVSISLLRKTGLILSFIALSAVICFILPSYLGKTWLSLFLMALALSWFLVYFQQTQFTQFALTQEQSLMALSTENSSLKQQLAEAKLHQSALQAEVSRLEQQYTKSTSSLQETSQILFQLRKEQVGLTESLQKKQEECLKLQGQLYSDTALEPSAEETLRWEQLEREYRILKHRFEEKSTALDSARRDLFKTEGALHVLQTQWKEEQLNSPEEIKLLTQDLERLDSQCEAFERQIESLHELTSLLVPFAKTRL